MVSVSLDIPQDFVVEGNTIEINILTSMGVLLDRSFVVTLSFLSSGKFIIMCCAVLNVYSGLVAHFVFQ